MYGLGLMRQFNGMLVTLGAFNGARWVAQLESGTIVNLKVENLFVPPPSTAEEAVPVVGTSDAADSDLPVFCQIDASHDSILHENPAKRRRQLHGFSPEALHCVSEDPYFVAPLVCTESPCLTNERSQLCTNSQQQIN